MTAIFNAFTSFFNAVGNFLGNVESTLLNIVATANSYISTYVLVILLVGVGIFFTFRTRFVQIRCFGEGFKRLFGKGSTTNRGALSPFQALTTAIAAQVGTGNIVGACGAILAGGPGAIFWMWVIAFFGMATIYAEATLAQKTRVVDADGTVHGGPVYYIKTAFKGKFGKFLAAFFALAVIIALGFIGSMVQSNSIAESINSITGATKFNYNWIIGIVLVLITGFVFIGGVKRIGAVTEKMVPIMAILYLLGGLFILITNMSKLPEAFELIFKYAFNPTAIIGGGLGFALKEAISQGAKRGLFSNEAGMGSTPHAHALADVKDPHDQGVVAMIGVFLDTFVVLTMTALVVIVTMYTKGGALAEAGNASLFAKTNLMQTAIGTALGNLFASVPGFSASVCSTIGNVFVAVCLFFFALSTIIGWNYFGKVNAQYLFGKVGVIIYSILSLVFIFLGTLTSNDLVWELTDFVNYLMVFPNVLALLALSGMVVACAKIKKKNDPLK